jgi:hypothetical protein
VAIFVNVNGGVDVQNDATLPLQFVSGGHIFSLPRNVISVHIQRWDDIRRALFYSWRGKGNICH